MRGWRFAKGHVGDLRGRSRRAGEAGARAERAERGREAGARIAVAEERERIARELHDVVAHSVSVMVLQAGAVRRRLHPGQQSEREALQVIETAGRDALGEIRRLLDARRAPDEAAELAPQPGVA